jgi:hypothetical protein
VLPSMRMQSFVASIGSRRIGSGQVKCALAYSYPMSIAFWLESISAGFFANFSFSSARMVPGSMSRSAARAPAYAMFFIRIRSRTPVNRALHMSASGIPRYVTSGLVSRPSSGHVESYSSHPPDRTSAMSFW